MRKFKFGPSPEPSVGRRSSFCTLNDPGVDRSVSPTTEKIPKGCKLSPRIVSRIHFAIRDMLQ